MLRVRVSYVYTFELISKDNRNAYTYIAQWMTVAWTIRKVQNLLFIDQARTMSFLRKEKANATTSNSHSMTSDRGSMPEQRMTSDWQIVNRCQLNSLQRPDTRWRRYGFADEFDRSNLLNGSSNFIISRFLNIPSLIGLWMFRLTRITSIWNACNNLRD